MPAALNNKFDALPPAEGLVFDFVFDFKARGQWKHWNDIVKNSEIPERLSPHALIPTVDTARFTLTTSHVISSLKGNSMSLILRRWSCGCICQIVNCKSLVRVLLPPTMSAHHRKVI